MMRDLRTCSAGAVAVITAMVLPVLISFTSLGVEVGNWYRVRHAMQGAADAAAISAAAQYIQDYNAQQSGSLAYQTVGQTYAGLNGFPINPSNICLVTASGNNCSNPPSCPSSKVCVVADISQAQTQMFLPIPEPAIQARAVVSINVSSITANGGYCILALANDSNAVQIQGNGDLVASCGLAIDGGLDQNTGTPPLGGIQFSGSNSAVEIAPDSTGTALRIAASSAACPGPHCFLYDVNHPTGGSTTPLPASAVNLNKATQDPYAVLAFPTPPQGAQTGGVTVVASGSNYTSGTRRFTVVGGTGSSAQFTVNVPASGGSKGKVTGTITLVDPGAYTAFPSCLATGGSVCQVTDTTGGGSGFPGSGATVKLTEGCWTWLGTQAGVIPGRKYCSINIGSAVNFTAGSYYIAGGDTSCVGFCAIGNSAQATSDDAGVTFYLTNGDGANSRGTSSYATISLSGMGNSGFVKLCAPGTVKSGEHCAQTNQTPTCTG
jgi:hypothetical protein